MQLIVSAKQIIKTHVYTCSENEVFALNDYLRSQAKLGLSTLTDIPPKQVHSSDLSIYTSLLRWQNREYHVVVATKIIRAYTLLFKPNGIDVKERNMTSQGHIDTLTEMIETGVARVTPLVTETEAALGVSPRWDTRWVVTIDDGRQWDVSLDIDPEPTKPAENVNLRYVSGDCNVVSDKEKAIEDLERNTVAKKDMPNSLFVALRKLTIEELKQLKNWLTY